MDILNRKALMQADEGDMQVLLQALHYYVQDDGPFRGHDRMELTEDEIEYYTDKLNRAEDMIATLESYLREKWRDEQRQKQENT